MSDTRATTLWSLAVVKDYCKATATGHDATLIRIADGVSERIDAYVRRPFVTRSVVERRDGSGTRELPLRFFPVQAVTEAKYRVTPLDAWTVLDPSAYEVDGVRGAVILSALWWPKVRQGAEVSYDAGFGAKDSATLPADVYQAALDFVKFVYDRWKSDAIALGSLNLQQAGSAVIVPALPKDVKDAIDPYVKRRL
jgi:hypothetical protein